MIVSPLRQALCHNRGQISKDMDPNNWVAAALPSGWALYSFHFFVDWREDPPPVSGTILMARLVEFEVGENPHLATDQSVLNAFLSSKSDTYFDNLEIVLKRYSKKVVPILLPEIEVAKIVDGTPIWTVARDETDRYRVKRSTVSQLRDSIQCHSGGKVRVGEKGLTFGTSSIECALSKTDSAFPGDVDAVVVDSSGRIRCILEYKKHTLKEPIGEHLASRYYPKPDRRKYQRLSSLVSDLNQYGGEHVNLIIIYYSINLLQMRVQELGNFCADKIEVVRDSKDFSIDGLSDLEMSTTLRAWLEIER